MRDSLRPKSNLDSDSPSFLRNPIVICGLGGLALAFLIVVVVLVIGHSTSNAGSDTGTKIASAGKTPTAGASDELQGITGKATSTLNVRSGPGNGYSVLGLLLKNAEVNITGRSDDGEWLQVEYPIHSNLHGWLMADSLDVKGDSTALPIATPEAIPLAEAPTYEARPTVEEETPVPEANATPTPGALPDLVISDWLVSANVLVVTVTNQGSGVLPMTAIEVSVFDSTGTTLLNGTTSAPIALNPGASIDIRTGFSTLGAGEVVVIVDPNGKIPESNNKNNRRTVTLGPVQTPTATNTPKPPKTAAPTP
jgi:hypothetical protein